MHTKLSHGVPLTSGLRALTLLFACFSSACGSSDDSDPPAAPSRRADSASQAPAGPLTGGWTFTGAVPDRITLLATFHPDGSFQFSETVKPFGLPAGAVDSTCVVTDTYAGTYAESGTNTLTWDVKTGTANAVSNCGTTDSPGSPMDQDTIESYRSQGLIPPARVSYMLTADSLVLTPGLGSAQSTTFTKVTSE
ncbi:MAG: hypothetical protein JWN04_3794 [Myxococcaceae bacterium]|nr:hypothetical protein [Myxococcaceae bacterium]